MVLLQGPPSRPQQKIRHLHPHFISGTAVLFGNIVILYISMPFLYSCSLTNRRELSVAVKNVDTTHVIYFRD